MQERGGAELRLSGCLVLDDEQARGLRLLLLGKGAVFAHRFKRSLTAEMDGEATAAPPARAECRFRVER